MQSTVFPSALPLSDVVTFRGLGADAAQAFDRVVDALSETPAQPC